MFDIIEIFDKKPAPINILDIGAQNIGPGTESYHCLIRQGLCRVIGFEPIEAECERLNRLHPDFRYLPYFIADGTIQSFYTTNATVTASLYEPNHELLSRFVNLDNLCRVVEVREVETVRLDDVREIDFSPDFIKCDVQGAELQIFENAPETLRSAVAIESEVAFVPLYKRQPLFGDVDKCLRRHDFEFHRFTALCGRSFAPISIQGEPNRPISQHLWSDAVYFKRFEKLKGLPAGKLAALAILLHTVYRSFDLCCAVLKIYDQTADTDLSARYYSRIVGGKDSKAVNA